MQKLSESLTNQMTNLASRLTHLESKKGNSHPSSDREDEELLDINAVDEFDSDDASDNEGQACTGNFKRSSTTSSQPAAVGSGRSTMGVIPEEPASRGDDQ